MTDRLRSAKNTVLRERRRIQQTKNKNGHADLAPDHEVNKLRNALVEAID